MGVEPKDFAKVAISENRLKKGMIRVGEGKRRVRIRD